MAGGAGVPKIPGIHSPKLPKMTGPQEAAFSVLPKGGPSLAATYRNAMALRMPHLNLGMPGALLKKFGFKSEKSMELPEE